MQGVEKITLAYELADLQALHICDQPLARDGLLE